MTPYNTKMVTAQYSTASHPNSHLLSLCVMLLLQHMLSCILQTCHRFGINSFGSRPEASCWQHVADIPARLHCSAVYYELEAQVL